MTVRDPAILLNHLKNVEFNYDINDLNYFLA